MGHDLKKKDTSINSVSKRTTSSKSALQFFLFLHALILMLMSGNKFHSVSNDSPDLMSVKSRLNISRLN